MVDKDIDKLAKEIVALKDNPVIQTIEGKQQLDFQLIQDLQNKVKFLYETIDKHSEILELQQAIINKLKKQLDENN
jgi:hypothetical protein